MTRSRSVVAAAAGAVLLGAALLGSTVAGQQRPGYGPVRPESGEVRLRNIRQLTFGGQNAEAYFSADGRYLTLQATVDSGGCDQQYVMDLRSGRTRRVSNGEGRVTCGYFYDRDRRVLFSSTHHADRRCPTPPDLSQGYVWQLDDYDIYTVRRDGGDLRRLSDSPGYDAEATLSPDGRTIVFTSTRDGDLDIYTMNVDGTNVRRLTHTVGYDGGPFFSHDGRTIVYRSYHPPEGPEREDYLRLLSRNQIRPSRMEIRVMNADGSDQRQVTRLGGANFAPFFTPDDRRIIFSSNHHTPRSRNFELYLVNLDGTGLERVTTHPDFDGFPMFSPDGRKLVWASNRNGRAMGETNIFIADWVP